MSYPSHPIPSYQPFSIITPQELPKTLLHVLERRWLEDLNAGASDFTHAGGEASESGFFGVHQVRHGPNRQLSLHPNNMLNVLSSLQGTNYALVYGLSAASGVALRLGIRKFISSARGQSAVTDAEILRGALASNFPGIEISERLEGYEEVCSEWLEPLARGTYRACITGIPSLKADAAAFFTQSVDRLVDALRGEHYQLLILAEPILSLTSIQDRARQLGEEIHALVRHNISASSNRAETRGESIGSATTLSGGMGGMLGALIGFQVARSHSDTRTTQDTDTTGLALSYERLDKTAEYCEAMLEAFQARLQRGRNLGFWNVGVFVAADSQATFQRAKGILRGLYAGQDSHAEPLRVTDLTDAPSIVGQALVALRLPRLKYDKEHPLSAEFHGLGTPLATDELAVMMSLPHGEVPGLRLIPTADFNLNPPPTDGFELGRLVYRGATLDTPVRVAAHELTRHAFVTGLTGSGKTNTCLALLTAARHGQQKTNFLVIDPAKTEYRFLYYAKDIGDDLLLFTLGDELAPFRLNPFEFDRAFPLLSHIDLVKAVFNAAFPMYASMPYLLEEAILAVYEERGWDVARSSNRYVPVADPAADLGPYLPRLSDLHDKVYAIVSGKRYGAQLTQDISAALKARLSSLLNGTKGLMLNTACGTPIATLLERPVVLELRGVPDEDEKAFVMALLFIRLYEACRARGMSKALHHLTLIEEAHRLMRHAPAVGSAEVANPRGKAVEMFADLMAEMRVYGEGFIVVDQMPGKLIPDVIKGSNLKVVHRLLALDDRAAVGNAMNLSTDQIEELPRLRQGYAVIHSEELGQACVVKIHNVEDPLSAAQKGQTPQEKDRATTELVGRRMATYFAEQGGAADACADRRGLPADGPALAERFLSAVLLGVDPREPWREVRALIAGAMADRGPCVGTALAHAAVRQFRAAHGEPQYWDAQLSLQTQVTAVWATEPPTGVASDKQVGVLRDRLWREVAHTPAERRPGCTACPMRCYFGHRLQEVNNPTMAPRIARFRHADLERPPDLAQVRRAAASSFGFALPAALQRVAAYCLLTQATDDTNLLSVVRRKIDTPQEERHE